MKKENEEFTLKELFLLFLPKFWIIFLCGVICAGVMGAYSAFLKDDTYTCSSTIFVYKERNNDSAANTYYDSMISQQMVKTYAIILESDTFLNKVIENIEDGEQYALTPEKIRSGLEIKQIDDTVVFIMQYTSGDGQLTYKIMAELAVLAETELKNFVSSTASDIKIVDYPVEPTSPDSKNVVRNALIAFIVGVVLSMIVIFAFNQFDVIIHDKKKIEDNFDIPILGVIPRQNVSSKKGGV